MGKAAKQAATNVSRIRIVTHIPAQMASPGPPLGSQLGELGVNIASFIKDFNLKTSIFKAGVPIPCKITLNADRTAGISRGAMKNEIVGMVTRKHVYEIAKLKSEDPLLQMIDLQEIVQRICVSARRMLLRWSKNSSLKSKPLKKLNYCVNSKAKDRCSTESATSTVPKPDDQCDKKFPKNLHESTSSQTPSSVDNQGEDQVDFVHLVPGGK
ncbi:RP-L11 [Lepeophtheirus salmonis]|uniref:Large ribosomal subunit protein uL11m n=1 Tax=Lepeophtheirus salmonis TaxID=72036 RepID=A0A7R8CY74_LEPSM|nr:RP-L11 [Lepeophtheirus salmonis]CAF2967280.1 RP-L11 [Lepeophtheirus salmonis]